jgi:RimJ/RimL family protein N-acetyltransferase
MSAPAIPNLEIRKATPEDAAALIEHVNRIAEESPFISLEPGEFEMTVEEERDFLADVARTDNSAFFVATIDGQVVGVLNCLAGKRRCIRHAATLGVSIRHAWRGQGIGRALMQAAIDWARSTGVLRRIELQVFTENHRAIHLYKKLGFVEEGRRRACAIKDGQSLDDYIMALLL